MKISSEVTGRKLWFAAVVAMAILATAMLTVAAGTREAAFDEETHAAMERMHLAMDVQMTGNVDRDFAAMMIPHHQGAIDMALAELRYGRNETLRRLAQEIVVAQQQEIVVMRLVLGPGSPAASVQHHH